jgi:hypothetical protein
LPIAHKRHSGDLSAASIGAIGSIPGGRLARAREDASQTIAGDLRIRGRWDCSARRSNVRVYARARA